MGEKPTGNQAPPALKTNYLQSNKEEARLSVALGQICLVAIHLGMCLGVPVKHPMVYNGHRSTIVSPGRQEPLPLYISQRADYKGIDQAIQLLEANLKRVYRALERLKEVYKVGVQKNPAIPQALPFPNNLTVLLYKICEFNV